MKRKLLSMVLAAAMTGTMLAGCGSSGDTSSAPASTQAPAAATEAAEPAAEAATQAAAPAEGDPSQDSGEIYMFIASPEYADAINTLIDQYKSVAPNVTINYETTQNDYPTMLKAKINSGDVPDIFSSTSGKEIDTYMDYSLDLSDQPLMDVIDPGVASAMASPSTGKGMYGIAIKGNYFGLIYNKDILDKAGVEAPRTMDELKAACEKISAAGYKPFTTGFMEWWVYKHIGQHFLDAAAKEAGITAGELVTSIQNGEKKLEDYPIAYNNFFDFIDLAVKYGDDKPLETDLAGEEQAFATGQAAFMLGQGAWVEADVLKIDPNIQIGFQGYPVDDKAEDCQVITGSDQALRINKDSENLQAVLDFINWWYTSDYGQSWFTDVAGVVPPIQSDAKSEFTIIEQGKAEASANGSGELAIVDSTDAYNQVFGEAVQAYIAGTATREETAAALDEQWASIDGPQAQ